jgi:hypothetical protein
VRGIALALLCLLGSAPAFAGESKPASAVTTVKSVEVLSLPSKKELTEAYYASGLPRTKGVVLVAYDDTGAVMGVKLDISTGSSSLDAAIMAWAAQVKLKATSSGISSMPFDFVPK